MIKHVNIYTTTIHQFFHLIKQHAMKIKNVKVF